MEKKSYSKKLSDPRWQKKRLEVMSLRGFKCELCNDSKSELHVHHRFYIKGREPWDYDNDVFQVLCHVCHEKEYSKNETASSRLKKYDNIISIIKSLDERDSYNHNYIEYFLTSIINDEIKKDETDHLRIFTDVYCNSYFGDVIKYLIRDYSSRENNDIELWTTINELKSQVKELTNGKKIH